MCRMSNLTLKAVLAFCLLVNISGLAQADETNQQINVSSKESALQAQSKTLEIADEIRLQLATTQENASIAQNDEAIAAYQTIIDALTNVLTHYEQTAKLFGEAALAYENGELSEAALKVAEATSNTISTNNVLDLVKKAIIYCNVGEFTRALNIANQAKQQLANILNTDIQPNDNEVSQKIEETEDNTGIEKTIYFSTPLANTSASAFSASEDRPTDSGF